MSTLTLSSGPRAPFMVRALRREPHLYSAICKARLFYSRRVAGAEARRLFQQNRQLFAMNAFEAQLVGCLRARGYVLVADFIPRRIAEQLYRQADVQFRDLKIDMTRAYSVQTHDRASLQGLTYEQIASTEKMIALRDPLIQLPDLIEIAFHESILKIAANFLEYVPPLYRVTLVRDFPHNPPLHSSNFHKDNDESDSLQIFIYLVDIDDTCGPLIYIPRSNRHDVRSCRPRLSRDLGIAANDGRLSDEEVERIYPREHWAILHTGRGSLAAIHGNGIHKGPVWSDPVNPANLPRTAIKLDLHGYKGGVVRDFRENAMRQADFDRLSDLQRLFAHASIIQNPERALVHSA